MITDPNVKAKTTKLTEISRRSLWSWVSCCSLFSHSVMSDSLWSHELQYTRLPCSSLSPGVCSSSCPLSQWCHPTISFSIASFASCPQSFPASGSFPVIWLFASSGQSIGASASESILLIKIKGWIPLGLTGLISLQSKGLSFSSTAVWKQRETIIIEAVSCAAAMFRAQNQQCSGSAVQWNHLRSFDDSQGPGCHLGSGCSSGISIFKSPPSAIIQSHVQPRWRTSALSYSVSQILGSIGISRGSSGGEESCS